MKEKGEPLKRAKFLAIILGVAFFGLLCFLFLFSYLYKDPLSLSNCELCFELNPALSACANYTPLDLNILNFSGVNFSIGNKGGRG